MAKDWTGCENHSRPNILYMSKLTHTDRLLIFFWPISVSHATTKRSVNRQTLCNRHVFFAGEEMKEEIQAKHLMIPISVVLSAADLLQKSFHTANFKIFPIVLPAAREYLQNFHPRNSYPQLAIFVFYKGTLLTILEFYWLFLSPF